MPRSFRVPRLSINELALLFLSVAILFMQPLKTANPLLSYIDEVVILICFLAYIISLLIKKRTMTKLEPKIIMLFFLFIIVGLIGNFTSGVERSSSAIITDIISYSKFIVVSLGGLCLFNRKRPVEAIYSITLRIVHLLVFVGLFLALANQVVDLGMRDDIRYGIHCFKFIYDSAAVFSWYCYMFLLVLTIDLLRGISLSKIIYIAMDMLMWVFTGRSRGFAFMAIYFILLIILRMNEMRKKQMKIRIRYFVILGALALAVAWNQIIFYFTTATQARNILLTVGFRLMRQFFPFGAGLGTFGTAAAQKYYSPIYSMYGISNIYGFTHDNPLYLTDTFWPAVIGEIGIIGLIIYAFILFYVFKHLYKHIALDNISRFIMIFVIVSMLGSSIATSVFAQNATIGDIFYLCMIPTLIGGNKKYERETKH